MIELNITGFCRGCEHIELDLRSIGIFSDICGKAYSIRCIHDEVCGKLAKEKKSLERKEEPDHDP